MHLIYDPEGSYDL